MEFKWTAECENCFQIPKKFLQESPNLRYPDPEASYTLYTDTSKYAYTGVLTQDIDGTDHPITYVSGLFRGSQLNWATLTKEAYAIYMSVKKLSFYIDTAKITVKSDHLPLKKFLEKSTMNSKVNNWAVELESQNITFEYIPGIQNTLADTLSRLIEMDKDIKPTPEEDGKEFGYFPFEELPPATTQVIEEVIECECETNNINIQHIDPITKTTEIQLPMPAERLIALQKVDPIIEKLRYKWDNKELDTNIYLLKDNILKRKVIENGILHTPILVPDILKETLLILAHDKAGHNGFRRTYMSLKIRCYWKGMKKSIHEHCTWCQVCAKHNIKTQQLRNEHFSSPPQPMEFIAMDLIGEFHPASSKGNRFTLTAVCMLTGFTFCIPIKTKKPEDVINAYLNHICCTFGPSRKILTDNGTEFKNKLWTEVYEKLQTEHKVTPIYSPQCNGRIEGFHRFLKSCIAKQLENRVEWDDLVWKATATYNFFPTESSGMAPFFLMFVREANVKHNLLASEKPKYMGMNKLYLVVAHNLHEARKARDKNCSRNITREVDILRMGDNMLVRDHTCKVFQPKYKDFCITGFLGKNQIEVKDNHGHTTKVHRRDVKKIPMTDKVSQIYEEEQINKTRNGRKIVSDNKMPNLQWNLEKRDAARKEEIQETQEIKTPNRVQEAIIYIVIFICNSILSIQHMVIHSVNLAMETAQELVTTIRGISRTSWTRIQKEIQTKQKQLHIQPENRKNQSYSSHNTHSETTTTQ